MSHSPAHLVVVDTETTGLDPGRSRLIDIAAVRLGPDLEVRERFATLVRPGTPIPLFVTRLTGIEDADVSAAPQCSEALRQLSDFVGDAVLIAHNAPFDREHLAAASRGCGLPPLTNTWFDTLEAALILCPELDRHALPVLAEAFGLSVQAHRALPDAAATAAIFARLVARAACLTAQERRLLDMVRWPPLGILDACRDRAAPPPAATAVADAAPRPEDELPALAVEAGDWRRQLDPPVDGADSPARPRLADRLPGYRRRPGQLQLASAAADVIREGGVGLFEAGTGMGKSLAYLLPAAFAAAATGRRIVVSTKTKALQRQLAAHELPLVADALPDGWRWALLMGRENYLCRRRLDEALDETAGAFADADRALALVYLAARARRGEVDLSALPYRASQVLPALNELARELRSSRPTCLGRYCPARRACHWRLARANAEAAHLVCVNHALLLTGRDTLPPFEDVVIDEAHLLYDEATAAFTESVDTASLGALLTDLRGRRGQRSLPQRLRTAARHLGTEQRPALEQAADACERAAELLPQLTRAVAAALTSLGMAARSDDGRQGSSGQFAGATDDYAVAVLLTPGLRELPECDAFATAAALLAEALAGLAAGAVDAAEALPQEHRDHSALVALVAETSAHAALLADPLDSRGPDTVTWAEVDRPMGAAASSPRWTLARAPLTPAGHIKGALWDRLRSAVLTSATLTVAGSFAYYRGMTGLDNDVDVKERVFPSPFDFRRQAVLVLEHDPDSAWRPEMLAERQAARLKRLTEITGGRTLALFTNKRDMRQVAIDVGAHAEEDGVLVLAQGVHGSAASLADEFRAHPETILLGVDALWTGQDFPGDALTCLIIAKLPFPRQGPQFEARKRACEEAGERWFERFYLPEAVLRFRQGFGRLIRTETDAGVVVVLDHRLAQKSYRRDFLASLPDIAVVETPPERLADVVEEHLRRLTGGA